MTCGSDPWWFSKSRWRQCSGPVLTSWRLNKTWACTCPIQTSKAVLKTPKENQKLFKKLNKQPHKQLFFFIWNLINPFLVSSWTPYQTPCWLLCCAVDSNISADVLSPPPSLSQALFTLQLGLPSLPTKYGRLIYRGKHDRSPPSASLSLLPNLRLPLIPHS